MTQHLTDAMLPDEATSTTLATLLSTLYTTTVDHVFQPAAHGHTQPLWGPPDPYLSAGRSIAPPTKALMDMGIVPADGSAVESLPANVQTAVSKGWHVLNGDNIKSQSLLPGFSPTRGILPQHSPVPEETPETFAAQVEWAARYMNVVDKLPYAALAYGMVEFFLLRPGIDRYKEDVEDEPARAFIETVKVTGVRLGVFFVIAIVTAGAFF